MQYGLISDIHGNVQALETIWHVFTEAGLTQDGRPVLNAGDNIGYGDAPEACIRFLRDHPQIITVQGNYDKNIAQFPKRQTDFQKKWGRLRPEKYEALQRDSSLISEVSRAWLLELPREERLTLEGRTLLLTHYAPGVKEGLGTWTSDRRLWELAAEAKAEIVVCGHTHSPFVREANGVLFVNPGTLGRGWYGRASYAILSLEAGRLPVAELKEVRL